jgi:hypothetical protein
MRAPKMGIPPAVDHIVRKALAREPDKRWQTAADLAEAIEEVYAETVSEATGSKSAVSRSLRGGRLADETATESDLKLRRSDIDSYEAGLKRRRWLVFGLMALVVGGAAAGVAWYLSQPAPTMTTERETNDAPETANRIGAGRAVTGYLGKRRSATEGDRDVYRVDWPAGERRVVTVTVTGLPNMDLNLAVSDRSGARASNIDEGRVGEGEAIHRRAIDGPLIVTVGQTLAKDSRPIENVSDPYTLLVVEESLKGGEIEPNGIEADANAIAIGERLKGYLDHHDDIDLLRFAGDDGTYAVTVRADDLPVIWQTADGMQRTAGVAKVALRRGEIIRIQCAPKGTGKRDASWVVEIAR